MHPHEFATNKRVRIRTDIKVFNLGFFAAGLTGTVVRARYQNEPPEMFETLSIDIEEVNDGIVASIRLDEVRPELEAWDNELDVFAPGVGECTAEHFEEL